jgi:hypothetical protein
MSRATVLMVAGLIVLLTAPSHPAQASSISSFQVIFESVRDPSGARFIAVRRYVWNSIVYFLLVNPQTLESSVVVVATVTIEGHADAEKLQDTPFIRALLQYTSPPFRLHNYGAGHARHSVDGWYLTVDLDPCLKPMDREMFRQVIAPGGVERTRVPVAIAVTGRWIEHHPEDLQWLEGQIRKQHLTVIWVNHSYHHPYTPGAPLDHNFLLSPGVRFEDEVLRTERLMLEHHLIPSPFFRFPGLVASGELIERLRPLSLIPLGSDAWLAKNQAPRLGSFILVHANGNDPWGVNMLIHLLHTYPDMRLLALPTAFAND